MWLGRRDLTRPAVAFGVTWFGVVAIAQLQLTALEGDWSGEFTAMVFGGGIAFVVAATLAGGTEPTRGTVELAGDEARPGRLAAAAVLLLAAGAAGAVYKADRLGGIPLLSENPDLVRGRAFTPEGELPSWSSALTSGFYLATWCALAALWLRRGRLSRPAMAGFWLLALAGLAGVSLEASRNLFVLALGVPAIALYLLSRQRAARSQVIVAAVVAVFALVGVGGLFALRLAQADSGANRFIKAELERQPLIVRPLVPTYINTALPFEAARRMHEAVPGRYSYGLGANSLASLPNRAFPEGKAEYGYSVTQVMEYGPTGRIAWAVAGYQGRLIADAGWRGVILGSLLLGLAFGSLHRWARSRTGLLPVGAVAYGTYYASFMVYDNQLSFSLIGFYDLAVLALVGAFATARLRLPRRQPQAA